MHTQYALCANGPYASGRCTVPERQTSAKVKACGNDFWIGRTDRFLSHSGTTYGKKNAGNTGDTLQSDAQRKGKGRDAAGGASLLTDRLELCETENCMYSFLKHLAGGLVSKLINAISNAGNIL